MTKIREIGNFLDIDSDGYIVSDACATKILPPWSYAVEAARRLYVDLFGDCLHSLYLRGSVARGMAIEGVSDLDMFAVLRCELDEERQCLVLQQQQRMRSFRAGFPFLKGIEISSVTLREVLGPFNYYRFVIKVSAVCIQGPDLALEISPFKTGTPIGQEWFRIFPHLVDQFNHVMNTENDEEVLKTECTIMMKNFLRAGMLLVMKRKAAYTRDLYPSYRSFSEYYPQHDRMMRQCLELALNPVGDAEDLIPYVRDFAWVMGQLYTDEFGDLSPLPL